MKTYDNIINLPHYEPKYHPRMSIYNRSAQFAPFAALTGNEEQVEETARITSRKVEIDEDVKDKINNILKEIKEQITKKNKISVTYFVPDQKKNGGKYITTVCNVKKIDEYRQKIILEDKTEIDICEIIEINLY